MKSVLVIAGTDSSGGAGLTRDAAIVHAHDFEIWPVVTAVTAQTNENVRRTLVLPPELVAAQIEAACKNGPPQAIKIGMFGSTDVTRAVAAALARINAPLVLDPVLKSSSGHSLLDEPDGLDILLPRVDLLTPNLDEAAALTGRSKAKDETELALQARALIARGARAVLIKGGHSNGPQSIDHLFEAEEHHRFSAPRLTKQKRGTGCALASAIACQLALGKPLSAACQLAKSNIHAWIADG